MTEEFTEKLNSFEKRWQQEWEANRIYEADPEDTEKFYITVAYPYPSGGMHVGHVGTYTLPDVFARYKRMQGFNVLFPMAWHVTGTPIIGALNRVKEGDEEQISTLRDVYNVPEDELTSWEEPMDYADYFIENSYKQNMKNLGFSVDWRREFTTDDEQYRKFIEWQYHTLRDKGLVKEGFHPVKYDLKDENPVTAHDLLEGEDAEKQEYSLVKFKGEEYIFPCATLRPETVFGATHIMVDPGASYKVAEVDGEKWIISKEAEEKLEHQGFEVRPLNEQLGEELVGKYVRNPVTDEKVMVLPAKFVNPDSGSGVVMSVPAHAPYDWISLQELKAGEDAMVEYGIEPSKVKGIEPKKIINVEGYEGYPGEEACKEHGVESSDDEEALEKATDDVYDKEFHSGTLNAACGEFASRQVSDVKEELTERFETEGYFASMWDFSEPVRSRSGGKVIVSEQESWFLEYGDPGWKDKVSDHLDSMNIIPEDRRENYNHTVNWLESWPCIRNFGLGTKLPFDKDFIVEPLSDSTIYMAFYTISHIIEDVEPDKLEREFFDYVFNGKGEPEELSRSLGIEQETIDEAREQFEYWYPLDFRTSAHELIQNHLTFMVFHHTALFEEENWPQGIATWGIGTLEGKKMSSSKGHVVLPDEAIEEYGADTVRLFIFASREPWQDFDWRSDELERYRKKIRTFYNRSLELHGEGVERDLNGLDRWALSKLQKRIRDATEALEEFQTRKAGLNAFFELNTLINRYRMRTDDLNREVVEELVETQILMMSPFTPHVCEELWNEIGNEEMVVEETWPEAVEELIDPEVEAEQELVDRTVEDIRELEDIVGEEYDRIRVIAAADWKRDLFEELGEKVKERPEFGKAMSSLTEGRELHAEKIKEFLQEYLKNPGELPETIFSTEKELEILKDNKDFIEKEFDAWIEVEEESESESEKASRAEPGKPAIVLE